MWGPCIVVMNSYLMYNIAYAGMHVHCIQCTDFLFITKSHLLPHKF